MCKICCQVCAIEIQSMTHTDHLNSGFSYSSFMEDTFHSNRHWIKIIIANTFCLAIWNQSKATDWAIHGNSFWSQPKVLIRKNSQLSSSYMYMTIDTVRHSLLFWFKRKKKHCTRSSHEQSTSVNVDSVQSIQAYLPSILLLASTQSRTVCLYTLGDTSNMCAASSFTAFSVTGLGSIVCEGTGLL